MEAVIDTVRVYTSVAPIVPRWDRLAARTGAAPFLWSGWVRAWLDAFGGRGLTIYTVWRGQEMVALLPMLVRGSAVASPANDQTPAFGPLAVDTAAARALMAAVIADRPHRVDLDYVDPDDLATAACLSALRQRRYRPVERHTLWPPFTDVQGDWDDFAKRISRNRRKALRRTERRLREAGRLRVEVRDGRDGLDVLLAEGFAVEGSGWKGDQGTAITSSAATRAFYTDVARWAAARGWLRLVFLRLDERAIAFEFVLRHNDVVYDLKGGYDETYRSRGPGIWLMFDIARRASGSDTRYIEWLGTDDPYKLEVSDGVRERRSTTWYAPGPRGMAAYVPRACWRAARVAGGGLLREHLPVPVRERLTAVRDRFTWRRPPRAPRAQ